MFYTYFCMHICILQRIDLDFTSMHYIKINIIILYVYMGVQNNVFLTGDDDDA